MTGMEAGMRALPRANETYFRVNQEGILCIQHQVKPDPDVVDDDHDDDDSSGGGRGGGSIGERRFIAGNPFRSGFRVLRKRYCFFR